MDCILYQSTYQSVFGISTRRQKLKQGPCVFLCLIFPRSILDFLVFHQGFFVYYVFGIGVWPFLQFGVSLQIFHFFQLSSVVMLKTFVLFLGCFLEEQWWISGIRYGSCSNWFVEVSFHLINQVFCFWLILFLTDFFTSYAGNHQGVQKVAFHQQYAPQQIGLDQWQQRQDTSCCH